MKNPFIFFLIAIFSGFATYVYAQGSNLNTNSKTLTYEELYDNPYDISKLFIHIQPIYGELFSTNPTAGFGFTAQYYHTNLFDIEGHVRTAYFQKTDLVRDAAVNNSTVDNKARPYNYYELVGTYHIVDKETDAETKFILFSKRYKGDKWAATVPLHTIIPTKVRKIYGARLGGFSYATTVNYNNVLKDQGVSLINAEGEPLSLKESIYGSMSAQGLYLGGSMSFIKNVAVQPDKIYGTLVNDLIFTTFLDLTFAPSISIADIYKDGVQYPSNPIEKNMIGFRAGFEGKFNRQVGWAYGAELGHRPGLKKSGFYVNAKISFPVFSTQLRNQVESFGK